MAGYGVPEAEIAGMIGIDPKTLRKHYRLELDQGHTKANIKANIKVAENLFRKATGDGREGVIATIFWLKARAGWKETSQTEISGPGGKPFEPITRIERVIVDPMVFAPSHDEGNGQTLDADHLDQTRRPTPGQLQDHRRRHHGS